MISKQRLADALGVTPRTIAEYIRRGCPTSSVKEAKAWRQRNIAAHHPPTIGERAAGKPPASADRQELKRRLSRAKIRRDDAIAESLRLKNAETRGELVNADEVEHEVAELTGLIRLRLESWPQELQTEWPLELQQLVTDRLADKVRALLIELAGIRLTCDESESEFGSETTLAHAKSGQPPIMEAPDL